MEQLQEKIVAWLENPKRDQFEGISLLSKLTTNKRLINSLGRNETRYKREKLIYEIVKLSKDLPPITTTRAITETDPDSDRSSSENNDEPEAPLDLGGAESNILFVADKVKNSAEDRDAAEQLEISYSKMYNLKAIKINSLRDFPENDNEGRRKVLDQVAGIKKDMESIRAKLDHFKEHGQLPPKESDEQKDEPDPGKPKEIPSDPVLMQKMLLNERSSVSKLRKKISEGASPELLKELEEKLASKTSLVTEIERRLNGGGS